MSIALEPNFGPQPDRDSYPFTAMCTYCGFPISDSRYKKKPAGVDLPVLQEYTCPYCRIPNTIAGAFTFTGYGKIFLTDGSIVRDDTNKNTA